MHQGFHHGGKVDPLEEPILLLFQVTATQERSA